MSESYSTSEISGSEVTESVEDSATADGAIVDQENLEEKEPEAEKEISQSEGQAQIFARIQDGTLKFPPSFGSTDLHLILENIELPAEFNTESLETYYTDCVNLLREEIIPEPEVPGEDEEALVLTEDLIAQRLSDLQPVEGEHLSFALTSFCVSDANISDISALHDFSALLYISLNLNLITSAESLSGLSRLRELNLSENRLTSFANIDLPSLEILNLSANKFCSIYNLKLPKLKKLILSQNKISFISPGAFEECGSLEELEINENKIKYLRDGAFKGLKSLKSLHMTQNSLTSLEENLFDGLVALETVDFTENPLETILGLTTVKTLKTLTLAGTGISQIDTIKELVPLKNLTAISFDGAPVQSIENYKSDLILLMPWVETIDTEPVTFTDRQDAMNLQQERKEEEERLKKEQEEAEAEAKARAAEEAENANGQAGDGTTETEETESTETGSESYSTYESTS